MTIEGGSIVLKQTLEVKNNAGVIIKLNSKGERNRPLGTLSAALLKENVQKELSSVFGHTQKEGKAVSLELDVTNYEFPELPNGMDVLSDGDKRVYMHDGEVVYTSEQNSKTPSFQTLSGFLDSPTGKKVEVINGKAADIALFGTINSNLEGSNASDWMGTAEDKIKALGGATVFNPNKKGHVANNFTMADLAQESHHLFDASVVVMNFEPLRGGLALAELRMAMVASLLTGHKLIVRMETPAQEEKMPPKGTAAYEDAKRRVRSRAVATADIEFFKEKFGTRLNMDFYDNTEQQVTIDDLAEKAHNAAKNIQGKGHIRPYTIPSGERKVKTVVLSGSSADARDLAMRLEIQQQAIEKLGIHVQDTYVGNYSGKLDNGTDNLEKTVFDKTKASRRKELEVMLSATDHIVYAGESLSPFGQLATTLLFSVYNGSRVRGLVLNPRLFDQNQRDVRDSRTNSTYRSHVAKAAMTHQLAKIMNLISAAEGVAPELAKHIPVIADTIDPVVESFEKSGLQIVTEQDTLGSSMSRMEFEGKSPDINKEIIKDSERLIPKTFTYGHKEIAAEMVAAVDRVDDTGERYKGYPPRGLKMTRWQYWRWWMKGKPIQTLVGTPDNRPSWYVGEHENRYKEGQLKQHVEDVSQLGGNNAEEVPLHPYLRVMLTKSKLGVVTGPGFYYHLGGGEREDGSHANETSDSVVLRVRNGKVELLEIKGTDGRGWALPGGFKDPVREGLSTAKAITAVDAALRGGGPAASYEDVSVTAGREAEEETGIKGLDSFPHTTVGKAFPVGDWRLTANAWPVTDVELFFIEDEKEAAKLDQVGGKDDAADARWVSLTADSINELAFSHKNYAKLAILKLEQWQGFTVDKQGNLRPTGKKPITA